MDKLQLEYLRPETARSYDFYLIPKLIIDHEAFDDIDYGSKLLYCRMLNRASLSAINADRFTDKNTGLLYIIYEVEQVMKDLRCARATAVKMLKQLDEIGLIEKRRQGQGKPSIIYVKDFSTVDFQKFNIYTSGSLPSELPEVHNIDCSYNNHSHNNFIDNNHSHSHSSGDIFCETDLTDDNDNKKEYKYNYQNVIPFDTSDSTSGLEDYSLYKCIIENNICYNDIKQIQDDYYINAVDELVSCMLDVICTQGDTVKIGNECKSRKMVKSLYLSIRQEDIDHIIDTFQQQKHKITHVQSYLKKMLYTVKQEVGHHYTNAVRADGAV